MDYMQYELCNRIINLFIMVFIMVFALDLYSKYLKYKDDKLKQMNSDLVLEVWGLKQQLENKKR